MQTNKVIEIDHLSYDYPDGTPALRDIHLEVYEHESLAVLGPNGAGKSTLLYHLNGTLMGEGRVIILGIPVEKNNLKEIRRKVGLVFQSPEDQLFCPTVFDDVAFGPLNMGLDKESVQHRVEKALEMMGLKGFEGRSTYHLSEGEKKRVALATVLSMDSEILALDEPTDNLDPAGSRLLIERIQSIPQTKVIVTHHLPVAADLCERAVLLYGGRKIEDLPMRELLKDRVILERFGFDADYAQWMVERNVKFQRSEFPELRRVQD
ncbi:MAG: cobalt ABC transporter ATP-binding protein [Deltaproteobacteria bacterium CG_4_8_14_3_um_filter_45_9]|nr:MAG: cobalt ABC transporter ATP-binding protein [Deltaproteobacteria bacterium CG03_land_8_20_14_0_80_45_14]PIX26538.1 MAG: cobalt ABC transporter ATP-binding protein [Deltaproteobacteria bacterium CG_4_8_14_3_um_filter_45_9]